MNSTSSTRWKIAAIVSSCALFALLAGLFVSGIVRHAFGLRSLDSASVLIQIKQLKELVTVKYRIQRVVGLREPKVPFGEESILLMVEAEALAGVDLDRLNARDVHYTADRTATITLPAARLLHLFLNEKQTKVWDRQITWWTPWVPFDPDLEHKARLQAIDDMQHAALSMGILDQAQSNAEAAIRQLLAAFQIHANFKTRSLD
jgi:hypothetical protein